ncbi:7 transmembrane receptor [Trichuris trichiura]|uniref:7 transmembrane receptor n=1 Tax=Trichuris trichiura TaxID=36087 RepID=A0A077Z5N2_TRITR|nr:7 transmembrane receptor [Trichuris trichiura]
MDSQPSMATGADSQLLDKDEQTWLTNGIVPIANAYGYVHGYLSTLICCLGILANFATIAVLTRPAMRTSVNIILAGIAACHAVTMFTYLIFTLRGMLMNDCNYHIYSTYMWQAVVVTHADLSVILQSISLWLTVGLAVVRYLVLRRPRAAAVANTARTGLLTIAFTSVAVCGLCFLNFLRNSIYERPFYLPDRCTAEAGNKNSTTYEIDPPTWWTPELDAINFWIVGIMMKVLPCVLLTIFIALLIHILIEMKRRQVRLAKTTNVATSERTSALLLLIVFVFWLTQLPQGIVIIANAFDQVIFRAYLILGDFWDLLSLINSCISFPAYCIMSQMFRTEFMIVFGMRRCLDRGRRPQNRYYAKRDGCSTLLPANTNATTECNSHEF